MGRQIFSDSRIHPAIEPNMGGAPKHRQTVDQVIHAVDTYPIVVVGMRHNRAVKKARQLLDSVPATYHYLEYGSYFSQWRRRLAIKMWLGWPTYPMVFIGGQFVGGFSDLKALQQRHQLNALLQQSADSRATDNGAPDRATSNND